MVGREIIGAPGEARQGVRPTYDIDSLTDVALRVFAERGFDGSSMDDVARAAGIAKASIYHHISGKEELLRRGLDRALTALFAVLAERAATAGCPIERLEYIYRRVATLALELRYELTVLVRVRGNSEAERDAMTRRRTFDEAVTAIVRAAQAAGEFDKKLDPSLSVRLMFGMVNSIVEWYRPDGSLPIGAIADALALIVFKGVGGYGK
jgi:AcrR family transcriptional regulator